MISSSVQYSLGYRVCWPLLSSPTSYLTDMAASRPQFSPALVSESFLNSLKPFKITLTLGMTISMLILSIYATFGEHLPFRNWTTTIFLLAYIITSTFGFLTIPVSSPAPPSYSCLKIVFSVYNAARDVSPAGPWNHRRDNRVLRLLHVLHRHQVISVDA